MRRADIVHLALLLAALGAAYLLPFELVLLSYVILGPAHYFTEISWLHDRHYFLPHRALGAVLAALALGAMFIASPYWLGVLLWIVFLAAVLLAVVPRPRVALFLFMAGVGATLALMASDMPFALVGILLPTFIHVCIFTLVFMTLGALRARSGAQGIIIGAYLAALVLILAWPPGAQTMVPLLARLSQENFHDVAPALGSLVGVPDLALAGRVAGLLSFVYTYHYLNWFVKADVIRWAQIPRPRLIAVAGLSVFSTALYFYNYEIGLMVLLLASMAHVMLEFPLNGLSLRQLAGTMMGRPSARARA